MELEELLERYEKEICSRGFKNKLYKKGFKNKLKFLRYGNGCGFVDYHKKIRDVLNFELPKRDEKEAFVGICDIRIDSLKALPIYNLAMIGALITLFATAIVAVIHSMTSPDMNLQIVVFFYSFFVTVFLFSLIYAVSEIYRFNVQIHAWYALKEGVLLVKDE